MARTTYLRQQANVVTRANWSTREGEEAKALARWARKQKEREEGNGLETSGRWGEKKTDEPDLAQR
ncbi:hypothetical protein E2562_031871 [Oryza meyeriana var. granulata]|uniref:Uncharacterized protein n=1 Tax=Oryza meyeriana var. granulata TaxID=110450 RepID=A0A6G1F0B6_9ORYZ|nr:hypothetical protein E2562_031871 [Oryza meyeriana var. granulata]